MATRAVNRKICPDLESSSLNHHSIGSVVPILSPDQSSWDDQLHALRNRLGVGHAELWTEYTPDVNEARALKHLLGRLACTVHAPFVDISLTTADKAYADSSMDRLSRCIEFAQEVGAKAVTVHPGTFAIFEDKLEVFERLARRYEKLLTVSDIPIGLENLKNKQSGVNRTLFAVLDDLRQFRELVPQSYFTVDVGHALQNQSRLSDLLEFAAHGLASVHLHDAQVDGSSHKALGRGELDTDQVLALLAQLPGTFVTLEMLNKEDEETSLQAINSWQARQSAD